MLTIPSELQARLDEGATTLAWCWRVERRDGAVFGFTDHDEALEFDDIVFAPETGFTGSALEGRLGMEAASMEISGLFDSDVIAEDDLRGGLWDQACVQLYRVDWSEPSFRVKIWTGEFGEISHDGFGYRVELNGLSRRLERSIGRIYSRHCDASLGDARCGLDTGSGEFEGAVCDKRFATCRDVFANAVNFRGFPFMPGNDVLIASPASENVRDGGSRQQR